MCGLVAWVCGAWICRGSQAHDDDYDVYRGYSYDDDDYSYYYYGDYGHHLMFWIVWYCAGVYYVYDCCG